MEQACVVCGTGQSDRAMCYRGQRTCCARCEDELLRQVVMENSPDTAGEEVVGRIFDHGWDGEVYPVRDELSEVVDYGLGMCESTVVDCGRPALAHATVKGHEYAESAAGGVCECGLGFRSQVHSLEAISEGAFYGRG